MAGRFIGNALHKVDSKGRVSVPASFRRLLEEGDPAWAEGRAPELFMIVRMRNLECIECYSIRSMEELGEDIDAVEDYHWREALLDEVAARSQQVQLDDTGRMLLPAKSRAAINLGENVLFLGKFDKFQIWDPDTYAAYTALPVSQRERTAPEDDPFRHLVRRRRGVAA